MFEPEFFVNAKATTTRFPQLPADSSPLHQESSHSKTSRQLVGKHQPSTSKFIFMFRRRSRKTLLAAYNTGNLEKLARFSEPITDLTLTIKGVPMTTNSTTTPMHKGAQIGLTQFDEALNQLNATRLDCKFDNDVLTDAEILLTFVGRLQSAADKLHEQCNR